MVVNSAMKLIFELPRRFPHSVFDFLIQDRKK